jgi:hypothetical protein
VEQKNETVVSISMIKLNIWALIADIQPAEVRYFEYCI